MSLALLLAAAAQAPLAEPLPQDDWLLQRGSYEARVRTEEHPLGRRIVLENGLVRRTWTIAPQLACIAFDNLMTGASMLRAVRPEARLVVDGRTIGVGGLAGQPNHAFLTEDFLTQMSAAPGAMRLTGYEVGEPRERLVWKRVRHHAPDVAWPPPGVSLRLDFVPGEQQLHEQLVHADYARDLLLHDPFDQARAHWSVAASHGGEEVLQNEGKFGEIQQPANHAAFVEMVAPEGVARIEAVIDPGTDQSASWGPGVAAVFADRVLKLNLRPGKQGFGIWDGYAEHVFDGEFAMDQPWSLRLYLDEDQIRFAVRAQQPDARWQVLFAMDPTEDAVQAIRVGKLAKDGGVAPHSDPGPVGRCRINALSLRGPLLAGALETARAADPARGLRVSVHYELYDGIPLLAKRVVVHNAGEQPFELDHLTSEILAVVETTNFVEKRDDAVIPRPDHFHVETDYAFGGMTPENAQTQIVHWRPDPDFHTQVNYLKQTPCLLEVAPLHGPDQILEPGAELASWWTFELVHDSTERERRSLAQRRMYRTLAPWVTENPLILHVVSTDEAVVKRAIDQAAACGFEMLSLSFGSGLNMEDDSAANHEKFRALAEYAAERGIHIGGYSLLASRRIQPDGDNAIHRETGKPGGQRFGYAPALASNWGQEYFRKLVAFFENTGFLQFTHDGSYPGDWDAAARPPLQRGFEDSQWVQWNIICEFYRWLRARGAYLRVPDFYYLQGANECGMGYREVNWSLPRAMQVMHTRQNIFDGTWVKTPSMGWMFVPLTQYHGGGAAATIEPLDAHLDHYERMLASNLGLGVQAVYRGHRLYDTPRVRDAVRSWVAWFKHYRDILESDLIHGRRADGRDLDWMLHVNPTLETPGMLVVYNPREQDLQRRLRIPVYYTGLDGEIVVASGLGREIAPTGRSILRVGRDHTIELEVDVPAGGMCWYLMAAKP